jgi:FkbM family methyltransferase
MATIDRLRCVARWPFRHARTFRPRDALTARRLRARRTAFYRPLVPRGTTVFDVGANVGNRVESFLALGATVIAIEPQAECAAQLRRRFGRVAGFVLVEQAAGREPGSSILRIPAASTIATLSTDFIRATQASGRFAEYTWDREVDVPMTTLDALIEAHGDPSFCKIDVEGYESEVLAGLTRPLRCVSFEYTPETVDVAVRCVDLLTALGQYEFNASRGESMRWVFGSWIGGEAIKRWLAAEQYPDWGDVYARVVGRSSHAGETGRGETGPGGTPEAHPCR